MVYRQDIFIDKKEAEYIQEILDKDSINDMEEGVHRTYEAVFEDGRFVEISLCVGQSNAYVDAMLYEYDGYHLGEMEPQWEILGEYIFETGDEAYIVGIRVND